MNTLKYLGLPNHQLHLKIYTSILFLRNINQKIGVKVLEAEILIGANTDKKILIPKITMTTWRSIRTYKQLNPGF